MAEILTNTLAVDFDKQRELIYKPIFSESFLERFFEIKENVQSKLQMPIVGRMPRGLKSWDRSCGLPAAPAGTSITPRDLEVCAVQSYYEHCPNDWYETIFRTAQKNGVDTNNIIGTEFETIIAKIVGEQTLEDVWQPSYCVFLPLFYLSWLRKQKSIAIQSYLAFQQLAPF